MYKSILEKNIKKEHIESLNKPIQILTNTNKFNINTDNMLLSNFFHTNGYIIIEDALDKITIDLLKNDLDLLNQKDQNKYKNNKNRHTVHKCFFEKSPSMVQLIIDSKITDLCQYIIADGVGGRGNNLNAHLIHNNAFSIPSGGRGQAPTWHTDDAMQNIIIEGDNILPNYIKLPVMVLTCMIWLSDCTDPCRGPTWVVPGSHRFGKKIDIDYANKNSIPMCGRSGTIVIINNQLWHKGSSNTSNIPRDTVQITFGRRIISHMFNTIMDYKLPYHVLKLIDQEPDEEKRNRAKERFGYLQGGAYS